MRDAQAHRGPDAQGIWSDDRAVLAHRRLSIIDLSADGLQPMADPASGLVISYNGEVYNYRELRAELEGLGACFRSRTDTEVALKAYEFWGKDCVERFRGMYALVIWDPKERELFLARDRLGIKPLYYSVIDRGQGRRTLLVASEVRALLDSGLVERRIDPRALSTFVWNGFVNGATSIVHGIIGLPPGTTATVDPERLRVEARSYWRLPPSEVRPNAVTDLGRELEAAVELRLVSDVPLGIFLSGGVDSSAVAALAVRRARGPIRTFSVGFEEAEYDESVHAGSVAQALGTEHTHILLTQSRFLSQLDDALGSIDQPTFDQLNTYFVSRAVREAGATVALAGVGGDELFGGYTSFRDLPRASRAARYLAPLPAPAKRLLARAATRWAMGRAGAIRPQVRWGKLDDVLAARGEFVRAYQLHYALFTREFYDRLLDAPRDTGVDYGLARNDLERLRNMVRDERPLHAVSMLELDSFVGDRLLRDCDAASMAVSLELRVPLLDHRVVEAAATVSFFTRPKAGFVLPIASWLQQELRPEVSSTFSDRDLCKRAGLRPEAVSALWEVFQAGAPGVYWSRVWSLYVLLWWCRRHEASL
jgi:asparagine synthase (glutamine-hydrolysing)